MSSPVYVDSLFVGRETDALARWVGARHGHRWCHLWSDDIVELHTMAWKIGLKREWFQDKPGFPHYDLTPSRRRAALLNGAVERDLMDYLREKRKQQAKRLKTQSEKSAHDN
jgi:hypothetical protein